MFGNWYELLDFASISFTKMDSVRGLSHQFIFLVFLGSLQSGVVTDANGATVTSSPVSLELVADSLTEPVLEITAPEEGDTITAPTKFKGTVQSSILKSWTLSYHERGTDSPKGAQNWVQFGPSRIGSGGTTEVIESDLGTLDTTLLRNGLYDIELVAPRAGRDQLRRGYHVCGGSPRWGEDYNKTII